MMLGESLESLGLKDKKISYYGAKEGRGCPKSMGQPNLFLKTNEFLCDKI